MTARPEPGLSGTPGLEPGVPSVSGVGEEPAPAPEPRVVVVCPEGDLPPGARRAVQVGGRSIAVLNVDGRLYALRNACPHQGAPLCRGSVTGTMLPSAPQEWHYGLDRQVLRCPWHGWEFDLATGRSLFDPQRQRVKTYDVAVRDGDVVLLLGAARRGRPQAIS